MSVWCNRFKDGQTALNDDPEKHRGRPRRTSYTDQNCVIVEGLIKADESIKLCKISKVTGIAKSTHCS
jgi:hypothetical protein